MATARTNGISVEYDERGEGEPVLFVMGLGGQLIDWHDDFIGLFVDRGFRAIRFDNRDVGLSTKFDWTPPSTTRQVMSVVRRRPLGGVGYRLADMADDAAGLLDALHIEAAHVVGASMGGMIAQELAIGHPGRVLSLCSIMSNTGDRRRGNISPRLLPHIRRLLGSTAPSVDEAVEASVEQFGIIAGPTFDPDRHRRLASRSVQRNFDPRGVERQSAAILGSPDRTAALEHVLVPTLVIHGLVDPLVAPSGGVATCRAIPGSRLLMIPEMGHDLPPARWDEIAAAIVANARRASRRTASIT
ncbi:MAG: alpha/beta fold hydrolase [Acidimicrobiales bacterium]